MAHLGTKVIFLAVLAAPAAHAEIEGYGALRYQNGSPNFTESGGELAARLSYGLTETLDFDTMSVELRANGEVQTDARDLVATHAITQAFAEVKGESFRLRFGRQLLLQGIADGFNPTDVISPRNFRYTSYETQGGRFGVDGVWGNLSLGDALTLSAYGFVDKRTNLLPEGVYPAALGLPDRPVNSETPAYGGRLDWAAGFGNVGVSAYSGPANAPIFVPDGFAAALAVPKLTMLGAEFETVQGAWRLYGEAALHSYGAGDSMIAQDYLPDDETQIVLGVERELTGSNRLGFQVFHRELLNERAPAAGPTAALSTAARGIYGQFEQSQTGASLSFNWESEDTLMSGDIAVSSWFVGDTYLRIRGKYRVGPKQAVYIYGDWFDGPAASPFGSLTDGSNFGIEFRQFF